MISFEEADRLFRYDPESGVVTRKIAVPGGSKAGDIVGTRSPKGFVVTINYKSYKLSRIVWLLHNMEPPMKSIMHIDGDCYNNRMDNLRFVGSRVPLTYEYASKLFSYIPETGKVIRTKDWHKGKKSDEVGTKYTPSGGNTYLQASINGVCVRVHRLAWLLYYKEFPKGDIDHISGDGLDNRIINLRAVSTTENGRNRKISSNNTSGVLGINKNGSDWLVRIGVAGKSVYLGNTKDFFEAICTRKSAELKYKFHKNHGRVA